MSFACAGTQVARKVSKQMQITFNGFVEEFPVN